MAQEIMSNPESIHVLVSLLVDDFDCVVLSCHDVFAVVALGVAAHADSVLLLIF